MHRRWTDLEPWEWRALENYARQEGKEAARRLALAIEAERQDCRAHFLHANSLPAVQEAGGRRTAFGILSVSESLSLTSRMEHRLYALFAE